MRLFFAFALALAPLFAVCQSPLPRPESLYRKAFQFIKADPEFLKMRGNNGRVAVFDSIVHQNQSTFLEDLGKQWGYAGATDMARLLDSLGTLDRSTYHTPYYSRAVAKLTTAYGSKKGDMVVLFSPLHNNMLLAEVSDNQEGGPGLRAILSTFDQSVCYLFVFGPDGRIKQHYRRVVSYD
ncbi:hypothetical protein [Hymenobacter seoulensis]